MSSLAIKSNNLGKMYKIMPGSAERSKRTLREDIVSLLKKPKEKDSSTVKELWALKNISFEINHGDVVGLIGLNGAGKSTLLKVLARITEPTTGYVDIYGRVGSLLEVGTGFHSELNGKENIYLGGAVLGMRKEEIDKKFDEIVDFSGVENFLETPVKRFSSGMQVRLAFSVAAHLEPEILLIDEVLAVGDAEFRKKSLGKMQDVAKSGRTVIFVSHNMGYIQNLCDSTILLDKGQILDFADTSSVVKKYMASFQTLDEHTVYLKDRIRKKKYGNDFWFSNCSIHNSEGLPSNQIQFGEPFSISIKAESSNKFPNVDLGFKIDTITGSTIIHPLSHEDGIEYSIGPKNELLAKANISDLSLTPGYYWISLIALTNNRVIDYLEHIINLNILDVAFDKTAPFSGENAFLYHPVNWSKQ